MIQANMLDDITSRFRSASAERAHCQDGPTRIIDHRYGIC